VKLETFPKIGNIGWIRSD